MAARPYIAISDHPIYSVFGSRMGFSGSADRMALIPFVSCDCSSEAVHVLYRSAG